MPGNKNSHASLLTVLMVLFVTCSFAGTIKVFSPDKLTMLEIGSGQHQNLRYRLTFSKKQITGWSAMGFVVNGLVAGEATSITRQKQSSHRETFIWPLGENERIENNYNNIIIGCRSGSLVFNVEARVFNGSIAFRYLLPLQPLTSGRITRENTAINFTDTYNLYQYHQESVFTPVGIDTFNTSSDLPSTLSNGKMYITVGEADNRDYTKAVLKRGTLSHSLSFGFPKDSVVTFSGVYQFPWRTISISASATGLHQFSELNLKLVKETLKEVPSWIKPGKLIRSQLNTRSGIDCINFAAAHNFQYIMFDAGWYGPETRASSDPTRVIPQIDLQAVINHGKARGIGVILYVNYVALRTRLDTILPVFKKWGVSGMKFGFVDGLTQAGITWLVAAIKKVNDNGFVLNIHDNYKPTGLSREFPALLTQEGIRGDENSPDAFHNTVLPFTRFLAGPADFTFCYPNEKNSFSKNIKVSMAQQLALSVIYFSPLQSVFWYGQPNDYTNEQEIEFFKYVPTVWNETRYLSGEIGKYISVARRNNKDWYIGNAAGLTDWKGRISFDFLEKGSTYKAEVYEDDGNGSIRKRTSQVKKGDMFDIDIKAKGGQAIMVTKIK